jgi:hypothetical protein
MSDTQGEQAPLRVASYVAMPSVKQKEETQTKYFLQLTVSSIPSMLQQV